MLSLFGRARRPLEKLAPAIPPGERVYAVGDIHGRRDLLDRLLELIDEDAGRRPSMPTRLIFLGDFIDRGPQSREVLDRLIALRRERPGVHTLMGNHEEILLAALNGERDALRLLLRVGGDATLASYGVAPDELDEATLDVLAARLDAIVPPPHRRFLYALESMVAIGDYLFVHAGIRPNVPLVDQRPSDLRWIREEFLFDPSNHGAIVIHGHSMAAEVQEQDNRIGIDTGAWQSGRLTALALEDDRRWFLST